MNYLPEYPDSELKILESLKDLFFAWRKEITDLEKSADSFVEDGFYPFYTKQNKRILYVGREGLDLEGCNYISALYDAYKKNRIGGDRGKHINQHRFHYRLLCIAYGILNNFPAWKDIPHADKIAADFGTPGGISFAFMNISKLSNEGGNWQSDWRLIQESYEIGKNNFIAKEVEYLDPDIIISMFHKADRRFINSFSESHTLTIMHESKNINVYTMKLPSGKNTLVLDTLHFSAIKKDTEDFYHPISEAVKKFTR